MKELFAAHPNSVGETYTMHLIQAGRFSGRLLFAGFACLVHAVLPFLFVQTASRAVDDLHDRMVMNRARKGTPILAPEGAAPSGAIQLPG